MPSKIEFKTEKRKISDLKGCDYNPRKLTKKQYNDLKKSISKFNYAEIAVINTDNTIVAGHQRLRILGELNGLDHEIEVRVPNRELTKEEFDEYLIRSNKNNGEWDWDILANDFEIDDLKDWGFEDSEFGFGFEDEEEETEGDDETPEPPEEPITVKGDLYELGTHRLLCGDSTVITDVEKLMDGKKADMVFTDPPYGVNFQSNRPKKSKKFEVLENDDKIISSWIPFLSQLNTGFIFIWTSWKVIDKWINATTELGYPSNMIIWDKGGGGIGDLKKTFSSDYEVSLVWHNGNEIIGKRVGSIWECGKDSANKYNHPTQKPVELPQKSIGLVSKPKSTVLDLFLGSGSTLIACEKTNRKCYGMELDPKYCDVIVKRYIDFCMTNNRPFSVKRNGKDIGASMYKGVSSLNSKTDRDHLSEGRAVLTDTLH
jgi:DNA modification methylase